MDFKTVADVRVVDLPLHADENGDLVVVDEGAIPFSIARMFTVRADEGAVRGQHAHRHCSQFLVCVHGAVGVEYDDGVRKEKLVLDAGHKGLLVPATIWLTQVYSVSGSVLAVLCDRPYEAADYIRSYEDFLAWRGVGTRAPR